MLLLRHNHNSLALIRQYSNTSNPPKTRRIHKSRNNRRPRTRLPNRSIIPAKINPPHPFTISTNLKQIQRYPHFNRPEPIPLISLHLPRRVPRKVKRIIIRPHTISICSKTIKQLLAQRRIHKNFNRVIAVNITIMSASLSLQIRRVLLMTAHRHIQKLIVLKNITFSTFPGHIPFKRTQRQRNRIAVNSILKFTIERNRRRKVHHLR